MPALQPPVCDFGLAAPDFTLPATDGRSYGLADIRGQKATVIMFICNHCPYVQAVIDRIVRDAGELYAMGAGIAAISANDAANFPQDSFDNMKIEAERHGFCFPYLYDETQSVARSYGAVCTPDFFGYDADAGLQYRGRLDASRAQPAQPGVRRDLFEAIKQIIETGKGPQEQSPSLGCSIKWKV